MKIAKWKDQMNASEVIEVSINDNIEPGTLIGFKGLGGLKGITAAYPLVSKKDDSIKFILFFKKNGEAVIDGTRIVISDAIHNKVFINKHPIIIDIKNSGTSAFGNELSKFFN